MHRRKIQFRDGDQIWLHIDADGYSHCPVCGVKILNRGWVAYSDEGWSDYDICGCGFEYGYDDSRSASGAPYDRASDNIQWFRERWLLSLPPAWNDGLTLAERLDQLKNIDVHFSNNEINTLKEKSS